MSIAIFRAIVFFLVARPNTIPLWTIAPVSGGDYMLTLRKDHWKDILSTMPISGGEKRKISELPMRQTLWVTAKGFYFIAAASQDEFPILSYYDDVSGKVRAIAQIPHRGRYLAAGLSATADGKQLLYSTYDLQSDLMVVENYR